MTTTFPQMAAIDSMEAQQAPDVKRWMHVLSHLDPKHGGISTVVPQLCSSLAEAGDAKVGIAAFCLPGEEYRLAEASKLDVTYWAAGRSAWMRRRQMRNDFKSALVEVEGVHIHGLWEQSTMMAARTARSLGKPYIVSAHGMLQPWALANKGWKKKLYALLVERATLEGAACLHALTRAEAEDYRRFGSKRPVFVLPNGVFIPTDVDAELFFNSFPELRGKHLLLFLGRIHYKKGLDLLVEAWAKLAKQWPEAHLVLAGPDSENTQHAIEERIAANGLGDRVSFTGMLRGAMKWSALAAAGCFILPSYSEGLSTSVLEAMGMGLPVIVTRQCNLPEVEERGAGWQIEPKVEELAEALQAYLQSSGASKASTGARGRRLVQERYEWQSVAQRLAEVYRWVSGGPVPISVDVLGEVAR